MERQPSSGTATLDVGRNKSETDFCMTFEPTVPPKYCADVIQLVIRAIMSSILILIGTPPILSPHQCLPGVYFVGSTLPFATLYLYRTNESHSPLAGLQFIEWGKRFLLTVKKQLIETSTSLLKISNSYFIFVNIVYCTLCTVCTLARTVYARTASQYTLADTLKLGS